MHNFFQSNFQNIFVLRAGKKRKELCAGKKRKEGSALVGSIARKKTSARVGLESRSRSHALKKGMSRSGASG